MLRQAAGKVSGLPPASSQECGTSPLRPAFCTAPARRLAHTRLLLILPLRGDSTDALSFWLVRQEAGPCPGRRLRLKGLDPSGWACSRQLGPGDSGTPGRAWLAPPTSKSKSSCTYIPAPLFSSGSCGDSQCTPHTCAFVIVPGKLVVSSRVDHGLPRKGRGQVDMDFFNLFYAG